MTTYGVAVILEERYHVMSTFYELHKQEIALAVVDVVAGLINQAIGAGRNEIDPAFDAEQQIESSFRRFLDANEMGSRVNISAAQAGVSHRKKSPQAKRQARPAFIDTGLYRASFRAKIQA